MSNIPLKGGDGNDDIETADKTKDNPAKMSECWKNLSTSWKVGIPLIITGAILIVVGVIVGSTVGESKQGLPIIQVTSATRRQCWVLTL